MGKRGFVCVPCSPGGITFKRLVWSSPAKMMIGRLEALLKGANGTLDRGLRQLLEEEWVRSHAVIQHECRPILKSVARQCSITKHSRCWEAGICICRMTAHPRLDDAGTSLGNYLLDLFKPKSAGRQIYDSQCAVLRFQAAPEDDNDEVFDLDDLWVFVGHGHLTKGLFCFLPLVPVGEAPILFETKKTTKLNMCRPTWS